MSGDEISPQVTTNVHLSVIPSEGFFYADILSGHLFVTHILTATDKIVTHLYTFQARYI